MKTLNSFIIKISFATQTGEKICLSREHWLMVLDRRGPGRGRKQVLYNLHSFDFALDRRVPGRGRKPNYNRYSVLRG